MHLCRRISSPVPRKLSSLPPPHRPKLRSSLPSPSLDLAVPACLRLIWPSQQARDSGDTYTARPHSRTPAGSGCESCRPPDPVVPLLLDLLLGSAVGLVNMALLPSLI
ncbi:hypothetical protein VPH35_122519 [Triticum aestivum]